MWKDSVELKVIRLEGFPCSSTELSCYFYYNDALHDQLVPINEEKSLFIIEEGVYRLEIINQNTQEEKSVSFSPELFKEDGVRWLPLFSQSNDYIDEIPEDVAMPRILLIFYKKKKLVQASQGRLSEGADELRSLNVEINDEPLLASIPSNDKVVQDYKVALEFERKLRDQQELAISALSEELQNCIERSQVREDSLLQLIVVKEEELLSAQTEISELRSKVSKLELESSQMTDIIGSLKAEKECLNVEGLRKELELFTRYFRDCDEISKLKAKLEAYDNRDLTIQEQENLLVESLKTKNLEVKRENDVVYSIGKKKVSVSVLEGVLLFRSLGNFQRFEEIFQSHERSMTPSTKTHKRFGSELRIDTESRDSLTRKSNVSFVTPKKIRINEKK